MTKLLFKKSESRAEGLFDIIHIDVWGPYRVPSRKNHRFFLTMVDNHSRVVRVHLLKQKSESFEAVRELINMEKTQYNGRVKIMRSDNALEFKDYRFMRMYEELGVVHQTTCDDRPEQNGRAERRHGNILEMLRALRMQAGLPIQMLGDCVLAAVYITNRLSTVVLNHRTPYESFTAFAYMRKKQHSISDPMLLSVVYLCFIIFSFLTFTCGYSVEHKVLDVGKELFRETLPLQMGSRYYLLQGLKPDTWYEVKISYPASIPAMFSLQLKRGNSDVGMNRLRKLLNTEKLIFKAEDLDEIHRQGGLFVLVTVEPEGYVAIPKVQERENILFNIVCDKLMLGIPHKAWLVAALALLCVVVGFSVPRFLPPFLLPTDEDHKRARQLTTDKDS